jgi:hypothetical protein
MQELVDMESTFQKLGRLEGVRDGSKLAFEQGLQLGTEQSWIIGKEIGFYTGATNIIKKHSIANISKYSERAVHKLDSFILNLGNFEMNNDTEINPRIAVQQFRARFKAIVLLFRLDDLSYIGTNKVPVLDY